MQERDFDQPAGDDRRWHVHGGARRPTLEQAMLVAPNLGWVGT